MADSKEMNDGILPIDIYLWHQRLTSLLLSMGMFIVAAIGSVVGGFWFGELISAVIALLSAQAVHEDFLDLVDALGQTWRVPRTQRG